MNVVKEVAMRRRPKDYYGTVHVLFLFSNGFLNMVSLQVLSTGSLNIVFQQATLQGYSIKYLSRISQLGF